MKSLLPALAFALLMWVFIALGSLDNLNGYPLGQFLLLYVLLPVLAFAALLVAEARKDPQ